ncbi:MAG: hypothetical protein L0332_30190 [Chloroflexi bacterium]|nr:hypothetical protein [Chloroflexota bacterium]MCI0575341.1 hypothetical protein [Chloroflexota bacterium]MCI0646089.1 hypothetical protein [Chloroflexota bacterium]MCI0730973.1 hypothetical protein [Chloroflexota bacterium]
MNKSEIEKLEIKYLNQLRESKSPEEMGAVYTAIAFMYANNRMQPPAKVIEYCEKATQYPIGLTEACQLYLYWGEALEMSYGDTASRGFIAARQEIARPYLLGLKLVLDNQTSQQEEQEPPAVSKYRYDGLPDSEEHHELQRQHEKEVAKREEVVLQNKLIRFRREFISKCVALYSHQPPNLDELRRIATKILNDDEIVKNLLTKVETFTKNKGNELL